MKKGVRYWHKKTWKEFSQYVRRKYADYRGYVRCYTCGIRKHWRETDAGHMFHNTLDYDERNVKPQCRGCNAFHEGRGGMFALNLIEELGLEGFKELERDSVKPQRYTEIKLIALYEIYKEKNELLR